MAVSRHGVVLCVGMGNLLKPTPQAAIQKLTLLRYDSCLGLKIFTVKYRITDITFLTGTRSVYNGGGIWGIILYSTYRFNDGKPNMTQFKSRLPKCRRSNQWGLYTYNIWMKEVCKSFIMDTNLWFFFFSFKLFHPFITETCKIKSQKICSLLYT